MKRMDIRKWWIMTDEKKKQKRQERLSQQLRANLIRRKGQARCMRGQEIRFYRGGVQGKSEAN